MTTESLIAALPATDCVRFTPKRKAAIAAAVEGGALARESAMARYGISADELDSWMDSTESHGIAGLRVTRCQHYRALTS